MKTANQIDSDCDVAGAGDGDFGVLIMLMSGMSSETSGFHGEPMPQSLGLGVLWGLIDVGPVRTPGPSRRRVLDHWGR